jgi:hypothetical protein
MRLYSGMSASMNKLLAGGISEASESAAAGLALGDDGDSGRVLALAGFRPVQRAVGSRRSPLATG